MSAMNVRTMPVTRALLTQLGRHRVWFVRLPDDSTHYLTTRAAVEELVRANAPGSAIRYIPEAPIRLAPAARNAGAPATGQREAPEPLLLGSVPDGREDTTGASSRPALVSGAGSEGTRVLTASMPVESTTQGRARRLGAASPVPDPRLALTGGPSTANG